MVFRIMIIVLLAGFTPMPCRAEFRDPTQPAYPLPPAPANNANADSGSNNELVLSAIWISSHSRRATINGVTAKQGQTIVIEPALPLNSGLATSTNTATASDKKAEQPNKVNAGANSPLGNIIAPLLATAIKSIDIPQLQEQNVTDIASRGESVRPKTDKSTPAIHPKTNAVPARPTTIKIISIHKNSVTINQNGESKTLQLVQRPYKTQSIPRIY